MKYSIRDPIFTAITFKCAVLYIATQLRIPFTVLVI